MVSEAIAAASERRYPKTPVEIAGKAIERNRMFQCKR